MTATFEGLEKRLERIESALGLDKAAMYDQMMADCKARDKVVDSMRADLATARMKAERLENRAINCCSACEEKLSKAKALIKRILGEFADDVLNREGLGD